MRQVWEQLGFLHWPVDARGAGAPAAAGAGRRPLRRRRLRRHRPVHDPADAGGGVRRAHRARVPRDQRPHVRPPRRPRPGRLVLQPRRDQPARGGGRARRLPAAVLRRRDRDGGDDGSRDGAAGRRSTARGRRRSPAAFHARYLPVGPVAEAAPGSLELFLAERYLLYSWSGGALRTARVHHAPYPLQPGAAGDVAQTLTYVAGLPLAVVPGRPAAGALRPRASTSRSSARAPPP